LKNSIINVLKKVKEISEWMSIINIQRKKNEWWVDFIQFDIKWINWKIETIFSWFDISYNNLNTSIKIQQNFLNRFDYNLCKVKFYKEYVEKVEEERKLFEKHQWI